MLSIAAPSLGPPKIFGKLELPGGIEKSEKTLSKLCWGLLLWAINQPTNQSTNQLTICFIADFPGFFRMFFSRPLKVLRYAFYMARRLKEQRRFVETEELLRWAVDGLRTELGEQKIAAWAESYTGTATFSRKSLGSKKRSSFVGNTWFGPFLESFFFFFSPCFEMHLVGRWMGF